MEVALTLFQFVLHLTLFTLGAPLFWGVVRSALAIRRGLLSVSVWDPYRELWKHCLKAGVQSGAGRETAGQWALALCLVAGGLGLGLGTPLFSFGAGEGGRDVGGLLFALRDVSSVLGGLFLVAALRSLLTQETTRAERDIFLPMLLREWVEVVAMAVSLLTLGLLTQSWRVTEIATVLTPFPREVAVPFALAAGGFFLAAFGNRSAELAATQSGSFRWGRVSGRVFAVLQYAQMLEFFVLALLFMNLFLPFEPSNKSGGMALLFSALTFAGKLFGLVLLLVLAESYWARLRRQQRFALAGTGLLVAGAGLVVFFALYG